MTWATAGNLRRISNAARVETGWTEAEQDARDRARDLLTLGQKAELEQHLRAAGLTLYVRGLDAFGGDEATYRAAIIREFKTELARWREAERWIRENVEG